MPAVSLSPRAYWALSFLAIFFTFWTLVFPATYLVGWLPGYKPSPPFFVAADPQAIVKFAAWPSIKIIHGIAGCLWTGLLPFQLNHGMRKRWPKVHRITGRLMMAGGFCVVIGYGIMEFGHKKVIQDHGVHKWTFYRTLVIWFAYTAYRAVTAAMRGDIEQHSRWAIRHAGPGLTFAAGRLMVLALGFVCHFLRIADMTQLHNKMVGYYVSIYIAAACCLGGAEWVVRRQHKEGMHVPSKSKRRSANLRVIGRKLLSHVSTWLFTL